MEESHDEELDRADFAQNCPKGHTDRAHAEVRIDEAMGRQVRGGAEATGSRAAVEVIDVKATGDPGSWASPETTEDKTSQEHRETARAESTGHWDVGHQGETTKPYG